MDKIKESFEIEVQEKVKNYLEKEYGNIADIIDIKQKKIKIIYSRKGMCGLYKNGIYDLFEDNEWKLARRSPDNIFQALHDLGIIEFIDEEAIEWSKKLNE